MNKALSLLGLAKRAGKVLAGEALAENAIRQKEAKLLLLATDASENTKKKFRNSAAYYKIPIVEVSTKNELGHAIGEEYRAIIAIIETGFANRIYQLIELADAKTEGTEV